MEIKTLPAAACQFLATVEVGTNGESAKTAPLRMVARSSTPTFVNDELGFVVHDFAGMQLHKSRLAVDYCHDDDQIIGYVNRFETQDSDLVVSGALVPYSADPTDKATEIIYKAPQGIPYEASIQMGNVAVAERFFPGEPAFVNGVNVVAPGPMTVFREWTLRGVAVCPYGRDMDTESALALSEANQPTISVTFKDRKETHMSAEATAAEATPEIIPADQPAETPVVTEVEADQDKTEVEATAETVAVETSPAEAQAPAELVPVEATAMSEGQKFLTAFGDQGGVWFAQGKSFSEAQALHFSAIVAERDRLTKENQEMRAQLVAARGAERPLSFSAEVPAPAEVDKQHANLTPGMAKFASNIKFKR